MLPFLLAAMLLPVPPRAPTVHALVGPALVVLLRDGCPCTRECRVPLNALATACRGKLRFVGLLDADAPRAEAQSKDAGLDFPLYADPKRVTIRALGGTDALDLRLLDAKGAVVGRWHGLCRANVAALTDAAREKMGVDVSLDLSPFTTLPKIGCSFTP